MSKSYIVSKKRWSDVIFQKFDILVSWGNISSQFHTQQGQPGFRDVGEYRLMVVNCRRFEIKTLWLNIMLATSKY